MKDWLRTLHDELVAGGKPIVRVVVATVRGSAPREPGACMLVSGDGERGTIGGGHLEFVATRVAREMLATAAASSRLDRFSLGASLGQCCGGIVELWFQRYEPASLPGLAEALRLRESGAAAEAHVRLLENDNVEDTIHRSKAVGEPPLMLAMSVFFALRDAVAACGPGVPRLRAPATPEALLAAMDSLDTSRSAVGAEKAIA